MSKNTHGWAATLNCIELMKRMKKMRPRLNDNNPVLHIDCVKKKKRNRTTTHTRTHARTHARTHTHTHTHTHTRTHTHTHTHSLTPVQNQTKLYQSTDIHFNGAFHTCHTSQQPPLFQLSHLAILFVQVMQLIKWDFCCCCCCYCTFSVQLINWEFSVVPFLCR